MEIKREDYFRESDSPYVRFCKYNHLTGNKYNLSISEFDRRCEYDKTFRALFYNGDYEQVKHEKLERMLNKNRQKNLDCISQDELKQLTEKYKNIPTKELAEDYSYKNNKEAQLTLYYRMKKLNAKIIRKHKRYRFSLILGTIVLMTSTFLFPSIIGIIQELYDPVHVIPTLTDCLVHAFLNCCAFMVFGGYFLITPTIIASVTLWPWLLRKVMFPHGEGCFISETHTMYGIHYNDPLKHYEDLMRDLKSGNIELSNAAAVIGGQLF